MRDHTEELTPAKIREFVLAKYSDAIRNLGFDSQDISDDFDLLLTGIIDSFGILEMITSIEDQFHIRLDMATIDAEEITIIGPLSRFVADNAGRA